MKVLNVSSAEELVSTYRKITEDDILEVMEDLIGDSVGDLNEDLVYSIISRLTGFGSTSSCSLCKGAMEIGPVHDKYSDNWGEGYCHCCIHSITGSEDNPIKYPCITQSYDDILYSTTVDELYDAIQARASYIEELINKAKANDD